ncbi:unnamed protein product [Oikopleura dioica]|uniref:Uncharacterized protein n=1 Tax=Oikopleura dioica TaxID=34765 RepID=E4XYC5_OIKDI|nr:unnamed protein product [Oikopleura dioica]
MSNLHSFEGWVIAVFDSNSEGCGDFNGIDDVSNVNFDTCFDKWYTGCRTNPNAGSSTRVCRNSLVESSRQGRLAFASQVDQRVSNMLKIDKKHVHWFASHAEGCDDQKFNPCRKLNDFAPSEEVYKEHIASKYGLSSKNLRLDVPSVQKMGAKMIWQNYRQGLDREFSSINDLYCADWDVLLTLCSTNDDPSNPDFGDVAWRTSNLDENFFVTDYRQFEIGIQKHWFGNNKIEQCVTLYVSPFSH